MTYPGGGGQGGWNEQPGWGQQQGDHPSGGYPTGGYQTGGYQTGGYPETGGFPQQGGAYGGLGVYGGFDQEPPKKSKKTLWLVLSTVVLVLLAGGGVTWFLLSGKSKDDPVAQNTGASNPPSSAKQTTGACKNAAMQCVQTSLGYVYEVPKNWEQISDARIKIEKVPGVQLSGVTTYGDYNCENNGYTKGTNGGALLDKGDINQVASDFAKAVATQFYSSGSDAKVELGQPKKVQIPHTQKDGKKVVVAGVQVDATVTQSANKCLASKGMVKVLLLDGSSKLHALVVNGDLEGGGGGDKPLPKEADLQKMIDSVVPTT